MVKYENKKIKIKNTLKEGESESVYVQPGDKIELDFELADVGMNVVGGDVVFQMPNGSEMYFVSLGMLAFEDNMPTFVLPSGKTFTVETLLRLIDDVNEVPVDGILSNTTVKLEEEFSDATAEEVTARKAVTKDVIENEGLTDEIVDKIEEVEFNEENDFTGYYDTPPEPQVTIEEVEVVEEVPKIAPVEETEDISQSALDGSLILNVEVVQIQASETKNGSVSW